MWDEKVCMRPIMPPYSQSRPDGQLKSTASAFNRLRISMPAVLVAAPTDMQNSLHHLLTSSISARHLQHFVVVEDNRGRRTDNPSGRHPIRTINAPTSIIPPYLRRMPFLPQPSQFILAWDRHRVMQIMGNTMTSAKMPPSPSKKPTKSGLTHTYTHTHNRLTDFCPGLPG